MRSNIHLQWSASSPVRRFRTGVSLHSHTLYSREGLDFISQVARRAPLLAGALRRGERQYLKIHGVPLDLSRGWWTPPLGPHEAWTLEQSQIQELCLNPLVSITDHDSIEAPASLQVLDECKGTPVSVEWTIPLPPSFLHVGVHNLPLAEAREIFARMDAFRRDPRLDNLTELLAELDSHPETLIALNHPMWDEVGIGAAAHEQIAREFVNRFGQFIHAFELNGLRPWKENRRALVFAREINKPAISGGDRHVIEPNAVLNLTNADTFSEFVEEIRGGWSDVLVMPQYREAHAARIFHNMIDVLRTYERHANGWRLWSDRVFYLCDDGVVRSLTELFGTSSGTPTAVTAFVGALRLFSAPPMRRILKGAWSGSEEVTL
jgi:hypothetical protein